MDCNKFQDSISEYLESALDARQRAECAAHRLICRGCRELYNDVRAAVQLLNSVAQSQLPEPEPASLEARILAATTAGEMLSCIDFDRLIERYFDGVILAPTFQTFQAHFENCLKCRRLMGGIEETIAMCREIKETEIEMPDSLHDRIVAATVGAQASAGGGWLRRGGDLLAQFLGNRIRPFWTPQIAAAALIFASSSLLILWRFGSVKGMATSAGIQAGSLVTQGQRALTSTGAIARTGLQRVSFLFDDAALKADPEPTPAASPKKAGKSESNPPAVGNGKKEPVAPASEQRK